jgi:hypothetical protein
MHLKTFIGDFIRLLFIVILDHVRSVPRKANINFLRTYWKTYRNTHTTAEHKLKNKNISTSDLLELYHKMSLTIWNVYWLSPSLHFITYEIDYHQCADKKGYDISFIPYIHYMGFNCVNHVYFFTFRNVSHSNQNQKERALSTIERLYNNICFPNSSLTFIMESDTIEELNPIEEFPEALFDTLDLKRFKKYHAIKSLSLIEENDPIKIYCNDNIPGTLITYWTFSWIFQKIIKKFKNHLFYMEEGSFKHFDQRMQENFVDPIEIMRWSKIKSTFRTFLIDDIKLEYYPDHKNSNIYKYTAETCLKNQGIYIFSTVSKHIYNILTENQCVQLPLIIFPSKGCLKNSNEDLFHFSKSPFYKKWLKILWHNIKLLIFIYID